MLGVGKGSGDFFGQLWYLLVHVGDTKWLTIVVGLSSPAVVLVLRRFAPVVRAPLAAVLLGIVPVHAPMFVEPELAPARLGPVLTRTG